MRDKKSGIPSRAYIVKPVVAGGYESENEGAGESKGSIGKLLPGNGVTLVCNTTV